ncbi:MAG: phenylalanine--tRNA ligase subunit beta [Pseudomonadota bacterium]
MKFSRNWLHEFLAVNESERPQLEFLLERLTLAGLEVDGTEHLTLPDGVVVARIVSAEQHPNADRLRVCIVDDGAAQHSIVCGAPNARAGIFVALATIGSKLPGGLKIKKSKLRGVESHGMLCSGAELGLGEDHDGIIELPELPLGQPLAQALGAPDDVIDVDLTPNRGDCFSLLGVARETAVFADLGLTVPEVSEPEVTLDDPFTAQVVAPAAAPVFSYRVIRDIDANAKTPLWMLERLRRSGIRSIHPVVDITNYVMLEFGQPMHAYDLDLLQGDLVVREAGDGESLTLLDGKTVDALPGTLLITDDSGPIGLAGIMGGATTAVSASTTNIVFEAAFFAQSAMAGQARRYGLHTDASLRFERGVDPTMQVRAQHRAAQLLAEFAGGQVGNVGHLVTRDRLPPRPVVTLRSSRLQKVLGHHIESSFVSQTFDKLGFSVEATETEWHVTPASWRFDIAIEEDLIEEVARVYGYDNLPMQNAYAKVALAPSPELRIDEERLRDTFVARGYREAITYSFVDPKLHAALGVAKAGPKLVNPISSELSVMRGSLLPGLLQATLHNASRQQQHLKLFEIGTVFDGDSERQMLAGVLFGTRSTEHWAQPSTDADFFDIKSALEALVALTGRSRVVFDPLDAVALHPGQSARVLVDGADVGFVGALHPGLDIAKSLGAPVFVFEIAVEPAFAAPLPAAAPVSRFPAVRRDIAVVVSEEVAVGHMIDTIRAASDHTLDEVIVFDIYQGQGVEPGAKSVAFGLILLDSSRTLTDENVDATVHVVSVALESKHGAKLRE